MWKTMRTDHYDRRFKRYAKKKQDELAAVLNNLEVFQKSLQSGKPPKPLVYSFLHGEPSEVIAVTQGTKSNLAATRLYIYVDTASETVYLLTLGDKSTQRDDIQDCKRFVKQLKDNPGLGHGSTQDDGTDQSETIGQEGDDPKGEG